VGFETTVAFDLLAKAPSLGHRVQAKAIEIVAVTQGSRDLPTFRQRGT
jgi:hypothetical protein